MNPKVLSREVTHRSIIEQVYFYDGSELIIKTSWNEGYPEKTWIDLEWPEGRPEWADVLGYNEVIELAKEKESAL